MSLLKSTLSIDFISIQWADVRVFVVLQLIYLSYRHKRITKNDWDMTTTPHTYTYLNKIGSCIGRCSVLILMNVKRRIRMHQLSVRKLLSVNNNMQRNILLIFLDILLFVIEWLPAHGWPKTKAKKNRCAELYCVGQNLVHPFFIDGFSSHETAMGRRAATIRAHHTMGIRFRAFCFLFFFHLPFWITKRSLNFMIVRDFGNYVYFFVFVFVFPARSGCLAEQNTFGGAQIN